MFIANAWVYDWEKSVLSVLLNADEAQRKWLKSFHFYNLWYGVYVYAVEISHINKIAAIRKPKEKKPQKQW